MAWMRASLVTVIALSLLWGSAGLVLFGVVLRNETATRARIGLSLEEPERRRRRLGTILVVGGSVLVVGYGLFWLAVR
jgi:hypothetical protein